MKKLGLVFFLVCSLYAQNPPTQVGGLYDALAFNYGYEHVAGITILSGNSSTGLGRITTNIGQIVLPDGKFVNSPIATNTPITVGEPLTSETVTPTAVSCTALSCTITATFANVHGVSEPVFSASFGLYEAVNYVHTIGGSVLVSGAWTTAGGTNTLFNAVPTFSNVKTLDNRTGLTLGGSGAVTSVTNSDGTLTVSPTTGAVVASLNLAANNIWTANGAASTSGIMLNGTWYAAGTGTTNFPYSYINCNGSTQPTTWSTAGTGFGINACNGFTGNFLDFHVNGVGSNFSVAFNGGLTASTGSFSGNVSTANGQFFQWGNRSRITSPADGQVKFLNNAQTAVAELQFGEILGQSAAPTVSVTGSGCALGTPATGSNNIGGDIPATGSSGCTAAVITLTWSGSFAYTNSSICPDIIDTSSGVMAPVATKTATSCTWAAFAIANATDNIQYGPISGR